MRKMGIWRDYLIEVLADRDEAIGYLQAILDDYYIYGGPTVVLRALETVVEAQGGVSKLAKQADMDPEMLSKVLSNEDTPLIDVLGIVLKALGYQLSIKPSACENANLEADTLQTAHVAERPTAPE
ncbi:MAG: transcriptional regulator [Candidatus Poribacteria bacterium]|nr:transcriptional regulator [Candidatus Poribacteria bacterium]